MVRMATFEAFDKTPIPPLRDVVLLGCTSGWISLTGTEEVTEGPLQDSRLYAQGWYLVPFEEREVLRLERAIGRLNKRLYDLGVVVEWLPGGFCKIPGEQD